ncbi:MULTISPECIES: glucose-1-phosphate thymidylyltransferase RfbA [Saccharothrix]|uniref:glucose-1-phosphate thymidylyltransferase RfbA n=1 Tax=Saccharothrix TaxID=2071 RepID=UPI00093E0E5A|nr:glucose-1-phosphate thymidylyltransferase RfbA [Saccharothrix sp. CB00851]OKI29935.1 glucose-1-phosphate thymidylyltransferase [Saccharothrix sp. CB00851]
MRGIILAGDSGTGLHPITIGVCKPLLPVYDKPLIYYPLSLLMLADIREILVIATPDDLPQIRRLLGNGSRLGLELSYAAQTGPGGIANALRLGAAHIGDQSVALVLGDTICFGPGFSDVLRDAAAHVDGCTLFGYRVHRTGRHGVAEVDRSGRLVSLEERPVPLGSTCALTGLYFYGNDVVAHARELPPSPRGELEITDLNRIYLDQGRIGLVRLGRGFAWLDTGTHSALIEAGRYIEILEQRQGVRVACVEEIALRMGFITAEQCHRLGVELGKSAYGEYVVSIAAPAEAALDPVR